MASVTLKNLNKIYPNGFVSVKISLFTSQTENLSLSMVQAAAENPQSSE